MTDKQIALYTIAAMISGLSPFIFAFLLSNQGVKPMENDFKLDAYCYSIAQDIAADFDGVLSEGNLDDALDTVWQYADGSEFVIYHYKAHQLCLNCNTDQGEDFLHDCGIEKQLSYDEMASRIAYGEIDARVRDCLYQIHHKAQEEDAA